MTSPDSPKLLAYKPLARDIDIREGKTFAEHTRDKEFHRLYDNYRYLLTSLVGDNFTSVSDERNDRIGLSVMTLDTGNPHHEVSIRLHPETGDWRAIIRNYTLKARDGRYAAEGTQVHAGINRAMKVFHPGVFGNPLDTVLSDIWRQNRKVNPSLKLIEIEEEVNRLPWL